MIYALVVFLSMGCGDVFSTAKIRFVNDGKRLRADGCEALSDLAQLGSVGVGAVQLFHSPPLTAALILFGLIGGSVIGTDIGQRLAARWDLPLK